MNPIGVLLPSVLHFFRLTVVSYIVYDASDFPVLPAAALIPCVFHKQGHATVRAARVDCRVIAAV